MTAIRDPGKVNDHTTLIDFKYGGASQVGGVYLIEAGKTCLIDSADRLGAPSVIKKLRELGAFPPDYIILTHSHWDHSQGVPIFRKKAKKSVEILASAKAIPLLEDQSYNDVFGTKHLKNIKDVAPLHEGALIDLDGVSLKIYDVPGHNKDHIAILDESNQNIFLGDSIGIKIGSRAFLSPIMPPYWNYDEYNATIDKLMQIKFKSVSLAHFGCIFGEEAQHICEESRSITRKEFSVYEQAEDLGKLEDIDFLMTQMIKEMDPVFPNVKIDKFMTRFMLNSINAGRKIIGKEPFKIANILLKDILEKKVLGYKISKGL